MAWNLEVKELPEGTRGSKTCQQEAQELEVSTYLFDNRFQIAWSSALECSRGISCSLRRQVGVDFVIGQDSGLSL